MTTLQEKEFIKFLKLLNDNDLLEHLVIVGSWAEFVYEKVGVLPEGYAADLATLDVDLLIRNLRKPAPPRNIISFIKDAGYAISTDRLTGAHKIFGENVEIEFLVPQKGRGEKSVLHTNLGVTAQALRYMEIIIGNLESHKWLEFTINVPSLESFVVHKMIINQERGIKKEKDRIAILNLLSFMDKTKYKVIVESLPQKWRKQIIRFIKENNLEETLML